MINFVNLKERIVTQCKLSSDELLFGRLVDGGRLSVDVDDKGETVLDIQTSGKSGDKPKAEAAAV